MSKQDRGRSYPARVISVHDGDTLTVALDMGVRITKELEIRLRDVYAPELKELFTRELGGVGTKEFVQAWIAGKDNGSKWPFNVMTYLTDNDKEQKSFDRYIASLNVPVTLESLNAAIIEFVKSHGYPGGTGS